MLEVSKFESFSSSRCSPLIQYRPRSLCCGFRGIIDQARSFYSSLRCSFATSPLSVAVCCSWASSLSLSFLLHSIRRSLNSMHCAASSMMTRNQISSRPSREHGIPVLSVHATAPPKTLCSFSRYLPLDLHDFLAFPHFPRDEPSAAQLDGHSLVPEGFQGEKPVGGWLGPFGTVSLSDLATRALEHLIDQQATIHIYSPATHPAQRQRPQQRPWPQYLSVYTMPNYTVPFCLGTHSPPQACDESR
jgi:hypothetical protein